MREIALVFIVANLLLALWGLWIKPDANAGAAASLPAAAERLLLTDAPPPAGDDTAAAPAPDAATTAAAQEEMPAPASPAPSELALAAAAGAEDGSTNAPATDEPPAVESEIIPAAGFTEALQLPQNADDDGAADAAAPESPLSRSAGPESSSAADAAAEDTSPSPSEDASQASELDAQAASNTGDDTPPPAEATSTVPDDADELVAVEVAALARDDQPGASADTSQPLDEALAQAPAVARCVSIGPFLDLPAAADAAAKLRDAGYSPRQHLLESEIWIGHWVLLPPLGSRDEAVAVVERLRELGVNDLYIEPAGAVRNGVSLGLFSDRARAETRVATIRQHGYQPVVRDRSRTADVYWIDIVTADSIELQSFEFNPNRNISIEYDLCAEQN